MDFDYDYECECECENYVGYEDDFPYDDDDVAEDCGGWDTTDEKAV